MVFNLRSASLHAPVAFLASSSLFQTLVEIILACDACAPSTAMSLSASSRPVWQSLEDIDVPLRQHSLSVSIDEAVHHSLLPCPCPGPLHCSTSCWGLAEQGSHLLLWVSIFTTRRVPLLPEVLAGCATPLHLPTRLP